ncbi:hypothetical protein GCM10027037_24750 [Mucilaginibacter koreensis]
MNKFFLKLVSFFYPLLERTGVNIEQLNEILRIKLLLDSRRPSTLFAQKQRKAKNGKVSSSWGISFFLVLMGLFLGFILMGFDQPFLGQTIYFFIFMVLLSLTMISDFTTVLLDTRDQYIILPRPVDDRTLAVSRIMHIGVYIFKLAMLQGLPAVLLIGFKDGLLSVPLLFVQIIEATFFTVFMVNLIYLVLMRLVTPEQFKGVISYFQIAFSVIIFGSYYLLPRLIDMKELAQFKVLDHAWAYALPPVWIGALNEVLIHPGRSNIVTSLLAIAGLVVPLLGLWLVAKVLAPGFNRRLAVVATSDGKQQQQPLTAGKPLKSDFRDKMANIIAPDPAENAGFKITWKMAARMREFKIKVYPAFAYVPIYFLYFALNHVSGDISNRFSSLRGGSNYILLIYLCTFVISVFLQHVSYSDKFKASWVYYALPVRQPGRVLTGMFKAVVSIYYFPFFLLVSIGIITLWGPEAINDIILAFFISLIYGILLSLFLIKGLPFSKPVLLKQSGGRIINSLLITGFIAVAGFGHYFLMRWETVIWILILPAAGIYWLMISQYKKQGWEAIEIEDL